VSNVARTLVTLVVGFFALILWPGRADAYPWMIRHEYNNCIACHVDSSGGGLLTPYGRGQSQVLLSTKYSNEEVNPGKFIFFAGFAELPNSVNLGAWFRTGYISRGTDAKGDQPAARKGDLVAMRYDFQAQVNVDKVKFNLSLGITPRDEAGGQTQGAWVTRRRCGLVSSVRPPLPRAPFLRAPFLRGPPTPRTGRGSGGRRTPGSARSWRPTTRRCCSAS